MSAPLLEARGLSAGHGGPPVVQGIDLCLNAGETVALVGPNAAGKSTLLRALSGALPCVEGEVWLGEAPLPQLSPTERARRLAVVPQSSRWELDFSVEEIVALGRAPHAKRWGLGGSGDRAAVQAALKKTETQHLAALSFDRLSGGERQRVLLARALAQEAPLLLLDEPTAHLDLSHQHLTLELIEAHARNGGAALVVLHDLSLAARLHRVAVLHRGRLEAEGAPGEVLNPDRLRKVWSVRAQLTQREGTPPLLVVEGR